MAIRSSSFTRVPPVLCRARRYFSGPVFSIILFLGLALCAESLAAAPMVDPNIAQALEQEQSVRLIGRLNRSGASETRRGSFASSLAAFQELADRHDITLIRALERQGLVVFEVSAQQWPQVRESGLFTHLQRDGTFSPQAFRPETELGADLLHFFGFSGGDQAVAILDTGVDASHPFFGDRVVEQACFSSNYGNDTSLCPNNQDFMVSPGAAAPCDNALSWHCMHGTHVAGIAAGAGADLLGLAPAAKIVAIQVFHLDESSGKLLAHWSDLFSALDWLLYESTTANLASVNISIGGERHNGACDNSILAELIAQLRQKNVPTVVASGNDGWSDAVNHPACISQAVTVGSSSQYSGRLSSFSNFSAMLDILAPGQGITSSLPGGGYGVKSGTSMAAPQVAGAFAVIRNAYPEASLDELELAFKSTGRKIRLNNSETSMPQLDLWAAFHALGVHRTYKYEAEDQLLEHATPEQTHAGYSGTGYANGDNLMGTSITFAVQAPKFGYYKLKLRYANGGDTARPTSVIVNDRPLTTLEFATTGQWHNWSDALVQVPLEAGINSITLEARHSDGLANLDYLLLNPSPAPNHAPYLASPMADLNVELQSPDVTLALSPVFADNDGDTLLYSVSQSVAGVASVNLTGGNYNPHLAITPTTSGQTRITVTASDGQDTATADFTLTINGTLQVEPPGATNLALNSGADGSSKGYGYSYKNVNDGDLRSFWQPAGDGAARIAVKWGEAVTANRAVIYNAKGTVNAWRLVDETSDKLLARGGALPPVIEFAPTLTRKLSLYIDSAQGRIAIAEFEVFAEDPGPVMSAEEARYISLSTRRSGRQPSTTH